MDLEKRFGRESVHSSSPVACVGLSVHTVQKGGKYLEFITAGAYCLSLMYDTQG